MPLIQRQHIVNQFNSQVASRINPVWSSSNVPSYADASIFGTKPSVSVSNISSSNPIRASTVVSNLIAMAQLFTNVRNCRRILTRTFNGAVSTIEDVTQLSALNTGYRQSLNTSVPTPNPISPLNLTNLYNAWNTLKNNTVTLTYNTYTEHSNHGSRSRR